jgi:hypothetical protein
MQVAGLKVAIAIDANKPEVWSRFVTYFRVEG